MLQIDVIGDRAEMRNGRLVGSSVSVSKHQFPALDKSVLLESTEITSFTDRQRQLLEIIADEISFCCFCCKWELVPIYNYMCDSCGQ